MHAQAPLEVCTQQEPFGNAFELRDAAPGRLAVDVYHNTREDKLWHEQRPLLMRIAKPIDRVVNAWLRQWLGDDFQARLLAQTDMPKPGTAPPYDVSALVGPLFFVWLIQLPLPWAVVQLVAEKQHRLRSMMRMHGLDNGAPTSSAQPRHSCPHSHDSSCRVAPHQDVLPISIILLSRG